MINQALQATPKGELTHLKKGKRKPIQVRTTPEDHDQLAQDAIKEHRSMSFIALRRYRAGLQLELDALESK